MSSLVRINHADAVMDGLRGLTLSPVPMLVFTSLAALSVPLFSDRCHVLIEQDGFAAQRIHRPIDSALEPSPEQHEGGRSRVRDAWSGQWVGDHTVQTSFMETPTTTGVGFRGTVMHLWNADYRPTGTDLALAQLLVDHAVAVLRREQGR